MARQGAATRGRSDGGTTGTEQKGAGDGASAAAARTLIGLASQRDETDGLDREESRPAVGAHVNAVHLVGRLGATAHERTLPSGDAVLTFHVVVDRAAASRVSTDRTRAGPKPGRGAGGSSASAGVDALACAAWSARTRRTVRALEPGTWVEVEGALRRRFRRGAVPPVSFYEVEVSRVRRVR